MYLKLLLRRKNQTQLYLLFFFCWAASFVSQRFRVKPRINLPHLKLIRSNVSSANPRLHFYPCIRTVSGHYKIPINR